MIEQENAATQHLALIYRLERSRRGELLRTHRDFQVARLQFFYAAIENDAAAIDKHDIGEHVLDLFHLMGGQEDGTAAIEVVVQQRIVELLAIQDVQTKCWLIQHQQSRVNGHHQGKV